MHFDTFFRRELSRTKRLVISRRMLFDYLNRHKHHTHGQIITERQDEIWSKHLNLLYSKVVSEDALLEIYLLQNQKEIELMSQEEAAVLQELADEELGEAIDDFLSDPEPIDEFREPDERRTNRLKLEEKQRTDKKRVQIFKSIYRKAPDQNQNGKLRKKLSMIRSETDYIKRKDNRRSRRQARKEIRSRLKEADCN